MEAHICLHATWSNMTKIMLLSVWRNNDVNVLVNERERESEREIVLFICFFVSLFGFIFMEEMCVIRIKGGMLESIYKVVK